MTEELYIGLMSGTSMDGIDAVLVDFEGPRPRTCATHHQPYPQALRSALLSVSHAAAPELHQLAQLDIELGEHYAACVATLLRTSDRTAGMIRAVGSHGQTIRHSPHGAFPYTLQIGDPNVIAERTGITTVADFRRRDIAAGGQGAPLVPAFHAAIFRHRERTRVILNLGGIANISILPATADSEVSGFDTGPANVLLDGWATRHMDAAYDADGDWAAGGKVLPELLRRLLADDYFQLPPPKSTGRELFNLPWLERHLSGTEPARDVQATLLELTAQSAASAIRHYAAGCNEVIVCGGGVRNGALMRRLGALLSPAEVGSSAAHGIDPQWVEAIAFAWLARQTLEHKPGNLPAVTGARHPVILGGIYPAAL